jgi:predicted acylesterase/phospholipase RssA
MGIKRTRGGNITQIDNHPRRRRASEKRPFIYLALAGGGVGALGFEIGGLCALERILNPKGRFGKLNDIITGYQGVSAGAIVSTLMALEFSPPTIRDVMLEQSHIFPPLTGQTLATHPAMYVTLTEQLVRGVLRSVFSVIEGLLQFDLPMISPPRTRRQAATAGLKMLTNLVDLGAFEQVSFNNIVHNVLDTLRGGLYSSQGVGDYINEVIADYTPYEDRFSSLKTELFIYAAELQTSQVRVFGTHGEHLAYPLAEVPISKCVATSCAIPVFFKPVYLPETGKYYMDGGVIKSLHLQNLIDRINQVRPNDRQPAIILTFFPFIPPVFPSGSDYSRLSILDLLSLSLKMTYLEKFQTALRSYRNEAENNIHIEIFRPSRHSKTARTHPLQDLTPEQLKQLNYEGEVAVYRAFLNDYAHLQKIFHLSGLEIASREEISVHLKACRAYYGLASVDEDPLAEMGTMDWINRGFATPLWQKK